MREVWRNIDNKVWHIRYNIGPRFFHFSGGRNRSSKKYVKPYANFSGDIGVNRLFGFHAWLNNEDSWGAYYIIFYNWTVGIGFSCYGGHSPHCDRRGSFIPHLQKVEREYRTDLGKPWRWILLKTGRITMCDYLHPNETHLRWEKREEHRKIYG